MRRLLTSCLAASFLIIPACPVLAQQPTTPPAQIVPPTTPATVTPIAAPAPGNTVAAKVNGQPITEAQVQKMLQRVPADAHAKARPEILDYLVENALIDQYLQQSQIKVEAKEIDDEVAKMKAEVKKQNLDYAKVLQDMKVTEDDLREYLATTLRWNKYAKAQATDKVVQDFYTASKELFDGSAMHVRHILLTPDAKDAKGEEKAMAELQAVKKAVEQAAAMELAKVPATADNLAREKARVKAIDDAFAAHAKEKSQCPSKAQGGDVGWFGRAGVMVEPFAKAAFALKAYEMSDVVKTQFGYHLILAIERKQGKEVKFEEVKEEVKEVYFDRLREGIVAELKPKAQVVLNAAPSK